MNREKHAQRIFEVLVGCIYDCIFWSDWPLLRALFVIGGLPCFSLPLSFRLLREQLKLTTPGVPDVSG